jgi:hypothetical protein
MQLSVEEFVIRRQRNSSQGSNRQERYQMYDILFPGSLFFRVLFLR